MARVSAKNVCWVNADVAEELTDTPTATPAGEYRAVDEDGPTSTRVVWVDADPSDPENTEGYFEEYKGEKADYVAQPANAEYAAAQAAEAEAS